MKTIKQTLSACVEICIIAVPLALLMKALGLIYPLPTLLTVGILTAIACRGLLTGLASVVGIVLYTSAWVVYLTHDRAAVSIQVTASSICAAGIAVWCWGVFRALKMLWTERTQRGQMIHS